VCAYKYLNNGSESCGRGLPQDTSLLREYDSQREVLGSIPISMYEGESNENLKSAKKSRTYREFLSGGIQALVKRWRTCIERNGDYVEK
jgi:hypothetical protein